MEAYKIKLNSFTVAHEVKPSLKRVAAKAESADCAPTALKPASNSRCPFAIAIVVGFRGGGEFRLPFLGCGSATFTFLCQEMALSRYVTKVKASGFVCVFRKNDFTFTPSLSAVELFFFRPGFRPLREGKSLPRVRWPNSLSHARGLCLGISHQKLKEK